MSNSFGQDQVRRFVGSGLVLNDGLQSLSADGTSRHRAKAIGHNDDTSMILSNTKFMT